jgi:hypothetical protein
MGNDSECQRLRSHFAKFTDELERAVDSRMKKGQEEIKSLQMTLSALESENMRFKYVFFNLMAPRHFTGTR